MKPEIRKPLFTLVAVVCLGGFLNEVVTWKQAGGHSLAEVAGQYWWAIVFVVSYVVERMITHGHGKPGGSGSGAPD